jgi:hypothetical protein
MHVSVGWPSTKARSAKQRRIGECWPSALSRDGSPHIFISPILDDTHDVAMTLVHELVHASGITGHKADFKRAMKQVGLAGKPTATHAGPELTAILKELVATLPTYPHPALDASVAKPKEKGRQRKLTCPAHTDYIIRASKKLNDLAPPLCGICFDEDGTTTVMEMED